MSRYLGEGDPWGDFLHHRARALAMFRDEGKTPEESARIMSMDPTQVTLILMSVDGDPRNLGPAPKPTKAKAKRGRGT